MTSGFSPEDGIVLVAHSKPSYLVEALTLAKSIRRFSPTLPIALVTNLDARQRDLRPAGFSHVVHHDFSQLPGLEFKLHLDELSPFQRTTLFLDSDCICYGDISRVFDAFAGREFVTLGIPLTSCHWFDDAGRTMGSLGVSQFPFFCGDFYLFQKTTLARTVFQTARNLAKRYDSLGINRIGRLVNDEPLFALAMALNGVDAIDRGPDWILQMQAQKLTEVSLDYTVPLASACLAESPVHPKLVHFQAQRMRPVYFRERFLVQAWGTPWMSKGLARVTGLTESLAARVARRLKRAAALR